MLQRSLNLRTVSNLVRPVLVSCLSASSSSRWSSSSSSSSNSSSSGDDASGTTSDAKEEEEEVQQQQQQPEVSKLLEDAASFSDLKNTDWTSSPYPADAIPPIADDTKPKVDPADRSVILFPGQGLLRVGAIKPYLKYPRVKELFEIANDILGYDLLKICMRGPQQLLDRTEFNQPATVVSSLAAIEKLQEERPQALQTCVAVAGYSVGELTALIFGGAMPYEEGLRLVGVRATAMQAASELTPQGMLSAYCTPTAKPSKICAQAQKWAMDIGASNPVCKVAIYMYTQSKVFGGSEEALEYIEKNSKTLGLRKVQRLPVSGAFHTPLMEPALKSFIKALDKTPIIEPNAYIYSNYSALQYTANEKVNRKYMIKQIVSPLKWEQVIQKIYGRPEGTAFPRTFDVGSKGIMKTILKNINSKASMTCYIY